jgi:hypothetical protein
MKRGDTETLKTLFKKYNEDGSALWLYSRALVAFREKGSSGVEADEFARGALRANRHVPAVLNGKKASPSTSGYLTMGGEDEAAHYFQEWGFD